MPILTPGRLAAWFAPKQYSRQAVYEVLVFTVGSILLAAWSHPDDPLLTRLAFPWLWLVCTVLALRYGTLAAFGSVGLMALTWVL